MNWPLWCEAAKLVLQLAGTALIARLTVGWALTRFKSEKIWERRLAAHVAAVAALGTMRVALGAWFNQSISGRENIDDESFQNRLAEARRRLDDAIATAELLLPVETATFLATVPRDLEACRSATTFDEHLDMQWGVVNAAIAGMVVRGKATLQLD